MCALLLESTERGLDRLFQRTESGELHIGQLPLQVAQFYHLGWAEAMQYAKQQAREYEHKLDVLYMQAFTPKVRHEEYQRRLDQHFQEQCEQFFAEPEIPAPARLERRAA